MLNRKSASSHPKSSPFERSVKIWRGLLVHERSAESPEKSAETLATTLFDPDCRTHLTEMLSSAAARQDSIRIQQAAEELRNLTPGDPDFFHVLSRLCNIAARAVRTKQTQQQKPREKE